MACQDRWEMGTALFVKPHEPVRLAAEHRLANGVIGAFRCVRSARYMKDELLPVYVTDPQHIASPLLALISYDEHERFEGADFRYATARNRLPPDTATCGATGQGDGARVKAQRGKRRKVEAPSLSRPPPVQQIIRGESLHGTYPSHRPHQCPSEPPAGGIDGTAHGGTGGLPGHGQSRPAGIARPNEYAHRLGPLSRESTGSSPMAMPGRPTWFPASGSPRHRRMPP